MRALLLDVPQELIEDRRNKGLDVFDEVWEGLLHMVPAPSSRHQRVEGELVAYLFPLAKRRDLVISPETAVYHPIAGERDYGVPDVVVARNDHI